MCLPGLESKRENGVSGVGAVLYRFKDVGLYTRPIR